MKAFSSFNSTVSDIVCFACKVGIYITNLFVFFFFTLEILDTLSSFSLIDKKEKKLKNCNGTYLNFTEEY